MCPSNSRLAESYWRRRTMLDFDLYLKIVREAGTFPRCHIIPQGGGEPFVHPRFREMLIQTKAQPRLTVGFVTNATRTTPEDPDFLVDLGIEEVVVSIYGHDAESYAQVTGHDFLDHVRRFVTDLHATRARRGTPWPHIKVQAVGHETIEPYREQVVTEWLAVADEVAILVQRDMTGRKFAGEHDCVCHLPPRPCRRLWTELAVSSDGEVALCCEDWLVMHGLGSLHERSIAEIWFGDELNRIREIHRSKDVEQFPFCAHCYMIRRTKTEERREFGVLARVSAAETVYSREARRVTGQ
jgi:MoaA/NifB/PqqE/SkfB family radical SAM enzyme